MKRKVQRRIQRRVEGRVEVVELHLTVGSVLGYLNLACSMSRAPPLGLSGCAGAPIWPAPSTSLRLRPGTNSITMRMGRSSCFWTCGGRDGDEGGYGGYVQALGLD